MAKPAVIVVNSHVVRGGVGGRAAVFALEHMGFPVWSLPTLSLGWHPGHGRSTRIVPDDAAFQAMVADMARSPHLGEVGAVLTGYLGSGGQIASIAALISAVKQRNPAARFLFDPNVGDNGALFQPVALAERARDLLLPLADIAAPNLFELRWLTGKALQSERDIAAAARQLGVAEVVVTSATETDELVSTMLLAEGQVTSAKQRRVIGAPKGTGDLFAALYLGHRLGGSTPVDAMRRAASSVGRLSARAVASGLDELPLAQGQIDLHGDAADVAVVTPS